MRSTSLREFEERQLQSAMQKLEAAGVDRLAHEEYISSGRQVGAKELLRKIRAINSAAMEVAKLRDQGATVDKLAAKVSSDFHPRMLELLNQVDEHKTVYMTALAAAEETVRGAHARGLRYALLAAAFAVLLAVGITLAVTRSIIEPLKTLRKGTEIIGQGNFGYEVGTDAKDEIGQLSRAVDQMIADLRQTIIPTDMYNAAKQQLQAGEERLKATDQRLHHEIAERKRVEEALEVSRGELRDFVHMASHDLRKPLRKISSLGRLLKDSLDGRHEKNNQENLGSMISGAQRMTQMIQDLIAYSRMDTKAVALEMVDLNEVVEELEQLELAASLKETGAMIEIPQLLPEVQADPVLIRQLLRNLIINGIKNRRDDRENIQPRILIRAGRTVEDEVRIEVQDNGIGIEKKHHEHIFTMSVRSNSRWQSEGAGTGLALCKKIVDKHSGRIGVESKVNVGSTFWFTMPTSKGLEQEKDRLISSVRT
jgi:signal transduction histidine kinase